MNKNEMIEALYVGKKITHNYFDDNEWFIMDNDDRIVFEDGCSCTVDEFWYDRRSPIWEDGWELFKSTETDNIKKCIIARYDETITEPPYLTIPLCTVEVVKPENDDGGVMFANVLMKACRENGYVFKFYTSGKERGVDYEIVVY